MSMKYALITGASRGVGRAIALRLANRNTALYLTGRDEQALNRVSSETNKLGAKTTIRTFDLPQAVSDESLCSWVDSKTIDYLSNYSNIALMKPCKELILKDWSRTFALNVTTPFLLLKHLLPLMKQRSSVVNILSTASRNGIGNWSSYCISKFALDGNAQEAESIGQQALLLDVVECSEVGLDFFCEIAMTWVDHGLLKLVAPSD